MEHMEYITKEVLKKKRQFLNTQDIRDMFDCGTHKACHIITAIKSVSDIAGIRGKVTLSDYDAWFNKYRNK